MLLLNNKSRPAKTVASDEIVRKRKRMPKTVASDEIVRKRKRMQNGNLAKKKEYKRPRAQTLNPLLYGIAEEITRAHLGMPSKRKCPGMPGIPVSQDLQIIKGKKDYYPLTNSIFYQLKSLKANSKIFRHAKQLGDAQEYDELAVLIANPKFKILEVEDIDYVVTKEMRIAFKERRARKAELKKEKKANIAIVKHRNT